MLKVLVLLTLSFSHKAQGLTFDNGKTLTLEKLKKSYQVHRVSTYNYISKRSESFYAFDMKKILQDIYENQTRHFFGVKVSTKDKYAPIIEMYKFQERKPFLAFARADQKAFTTIHIYKDKRRRASRQWSHK